MLEIDDSDLVKFGESLKYLERHFPKESKRMLSGVGGKARTIIRKKAREEVGKKSGNYLKSIKRGKVFKSKSDELTVRVFHNNRIAPHYHLVENGHRIVGKDGSEHGFKEGYHIFDKAHHAIDVEFGKILETEFDKMFKKL